MDIIANDDKVIVKTIKIPKMTIFSGGRVDLTNRFWRNIGPDKPKISIQSNRYDVSFKHLTKLEI